VEKQTKIIAKKVDRRCRRTKNAIKNALLKILKRKNLNKITVSELVELADVNRKSFYNHYSDMKSVLSELEDDFVERVFSLMNRENLMLDINEPGVFIKKLTLEIENNSEFYQLLVEAKAYSNLGQKMKKCLRQHLKKVALKELVNLNAFDVYADFMMSGIISVYENWFHSKRELSIEEISDLICEIVVAIDVSLREKIFRK
jgi:AcrR family transcriptional regulator